MKLTNKGQLKTAVYSKTTEYVDTESGEIIVSETESISKMVSEPAFIKVYLDEISIINEIPKTGTSVLFELLKLMKYSKDNNEIILNAALRKRIAAELNISSFTFNNEISRLLKSDILYKTDNNIYQASPFLFGKGTWQDVYKCREIILKVIIKSNGEKRLMTDFNYSKSVI